MFAYDDDIPTDTLKRMNKTKKEYRYAGDLSSEEINQFRTLNRFLKKYEKKIVHDIESLYDYAMQKVADTTEWMDSYEGIEFKVHFFLKENDEAWDDDEEDNNIIVTMMDYVFEPPLTFMGSGEDHTIVNIAPDLGEIHCWMFHSLYDHSNLSWDDMLRIGSVGIECSLTLGRDNDKIYCTDEKKGQK